MVCRNELLKEIWPSNIICYEKSNKVLRLKEASNRASNGSRNKVSNKVSDMASNRASNKD